MTKENLPEHGAHPEYAKYCDHTVLRAYTTSDVVEKFCEEGIRYGAAAICVNPVHVALVKKHLMGTGIKTSVVVGFPLGANKTSTKAFETREAVRDGADEIDMVINIGALREGDYAYVLEDIKAVVQAAGRAAVKVIIETCYLTKEQKIKACALSKQAGAAFVKTSTGMGTGGATEEDVRLMKEAVGEGMFVKASGGVDNRAAAYKMLRAGADRLGVSRVPQIVADDTEQDSVSKHNQPPVCG